MYPVSYTHLDVYKRQLIKSLSVSPKQTLGLLVGIMEKFHNFMVDLRSRIVAAVQNRPAGKVLVFLGSKAHKPEFLRHTVLGDHGSGHLGCLLNIIGSSGGYCIKNNLLCQMCIRDSFQPLLEVR